MSYSTNGSSFKNSGYSDSRNSSSYIEVREYRFSEEELRNKGYNTKAASPHVIPKATSVHTRPSCLDSSIKDSHNSAILMGRSAWKSSGLCKRSSEYEDVYNRRLVREYSSGKSTPGRYGRHSFKEERSSGGHRGIDGDLKDKGSSKRSPGRSRKIKKKVGNTRNARYAGDLRDTTVIRGSEETRDKVRRKGTRIYEPDIRITGNNKNAEDKNRQSTEDTKVYRGLVGITGIRRSIRGDTNGENSSIRIARKNDVNIGVTNPNGGSLSSYAVHSSTQPRYIKSNNPSINSPVAKVPPPIAPKPIRPKLLQATRSNSLTGSVRSATSVSSATSRGTQNSAASISTVKSILKKPKVGRLVLRETPSSFTLFAMISCILCFPFGIYALVKSNQVKTAVKENDYETASRASKKIKGVCIGVTITYFGVVIIAGTLIAKYFITGKVF